MKVLKTVKIDVKNRISVYGIFKEGEPVVIRKDENGSIVMERIDGDVIYVGRVRKGSKIKLDDEALERLKREMELSRDDFLVIYEENGKYYLKKIVI